LSLSGSSELMSESASIASCHLNAFHLNALCEIPNATDGYGTVNPGFPLVTLFKVPGGLMDRRPQRVWGRYDIVRGLGTAKWLRRSVPHDFA